MWRVFVPRPGRCGRGLRRRREAAWSEPVNMDFSRLHTYTPPQCVPENTGYTYALSSSYSSDALDFETEHRLEPVFDSPRMSRRSLRLITTTAAYSSGDGQTVDTHISTSRATPAKGRETRTVKQRSASKPAFSINHLSGKGLSSSTSHDSSCSLRSATVLRHPVLDESLIREQTKVDHFWGLDDDGDLKGGNKAATQGNGELAAEVASSNGYTCRDCRMLSARTDALTAHSAVHGPTSRVYSRDRTLRPRGASFYLDRTLWLAKYTSSSFASFIVQLFQVVLMKLNFESETYKLKGYESRAYESQSYETKSHESEAHLGHCGRMTAGELSRVDGESLCDLLVRALRRTRAAGWSVAEAMWSVLWLAVTAPGKAASGTFWWLGSGWYQFVTLISWLNVFLLTRCLRNICKVFVLLLPLLLLLGAGFSLWGQGNFFSLLPMLNWTAMQPAQRVDNPKDMHRPGPLSPSPPLKVDPMASQWPQESDMGQKIASLSAQCHNHDERLAELTVLLQKLQIRVDQVDDGREGLSLWVKDMVGQHLQEIGSIEPPDAKTDFLTLHHDHEVRLSSLEDVLRKLTEKSEAIQKELEETKLRAGSRDEEQPLLDRVQHLELELNLLKSQLSDWQHLRSSCEQADARIQETVQLMFSEDQPGGSLEWLLQKLSSRFVSKDELQVLLHDLELKLLQNITHHITVTGQAPTSEAIVSAMSQAGISGITEAQAHIIVNNALRLYSQDKTGMVDFALESGGGSILSTRCSETYETKTALLSLFGVPLWYFSQSPRVVIQPDIYPGNCWAFKGSQGYLVVRLSMKIYPTTFTMEHIPKTLSPTGNISSAPRDFAVYGLETEYQEEGQPLGRFTYDQEGDSLQMFHTLERPDQGFQIVELRVLSNWGHPEYTCLYRFRVHGEPIQ
ncbi:SUN domain-containing protein 1 isoform X7 [Rattus norvegicus]|uniref:Sad1 and UNC84 domain containing 1 n=3 Tax=Rattus norvegicus TaxID=10116 RepID=A0A8I6ALL7_RAT|nr:SUN domain-containing protein 1 isoform X5 [Rattus norvegicus]|eukprot:XP_006249010.1 PREDICTED: SUN domain-containing protein 1 isoform X4 [Rattus norvegicus]